MFLALAPVQAAAVAVAVAVDVVHRVELNQVCDDVDDDDDEVEKVDSTVRQNISRGLVSRREVRVVKMNVNNNNNYKLSDLVALFWWL